MTKSKEVRRIGVELEAEVAAHGWTDKAFKMERALWLAMARFTERAEAAR